MSCEARARLMEMQQRAVANLQAAMSDKDATMYAQALADEVSRRLTEHVNRCPRCQLPDDERVVLREAAKKK